MFFFMLQARSELEDSKKCLEECRLILQMSEDKVTLNTFRPSDYPYEHTLNLSCLMQCTKLEEERAVLVRNISVLFRTAVLEVRAGP
jgi:hypothetical protein